MIPHSQLMEDAVRFGHSVDTVVDVYRGNTLVYPNAPCTGGSVKSDRTSKVRWTATVQLGLYPWELLPLLDIARSRFVVKRGITTLGYEETLQLGEYRVDSTGRTELGKVSLTGDGPEGYVVDARFLVPRTPPRGQSTIQAIADLIGEAMPSVRTVLAMNTYDKPVTATAAWPRDRIDAAIALADSIRAEVFADNTGTWVLKDNPTLQLPAPCYTVNAGESGVLITETPGDTRDGVYNAVSVTGRSDVEGQPPVWGWAYDADETSPTYWFGPFGHKPRFYSSDMLSTPDQCVQVARNQLRSALTANRSYAFTSAPLPFLEAGDAVQVIHPDGSADYYLLNTVTHDLAVGAALQADTFKMRTDMGDS